MCRYGCNDAHGFTVGRADIVVKEKYDQRCVIPGDEQLRAFRNERMIPGT